MIKQHTRLDTDNNIVELWETHNGKIVYRERHVTFDGMVVFIHSYDENNNLLQIYDVRKKLNLLVDTF